MTASPATTGGDMKTQHIRTSSTGSSGALHHQQQQQRVRSQIIQQHKNVAGGKVALPGMMNNEFRERAG